MSVCHTTKYPLYLSAWLSQHDTTFELKHDRIMFKTRLLNTTRSRFAQLYLAANAEEGVLELLEECRFSFDAGLLDFDPKLGIERVVGDALRDVLG